MQLTWCLIVATLLSFFCFCSGVGLDSCFDLCGGSPSSLMLRARNEYSEAATSVNSIQADLKFAHILVEVITAFESASVDATRDDLRRWDSELSRIPPYSHPVVGPAIKLKNLLASRKSIIDRMHESGRSKGDVLLLRILNDRLKESLHADRLEVFKNDQQLIRESKVHMRTLIDDLATASGLLQGATAEPGSAADLRRLIRLCTDIKRRVESPKWSLVKGIGGLRQLGNSDLVSEYVKLVEQDMGSRALTFDQVTHLLETRSDSFGEFHQFLLAHAELYESSSLGISNKIWRRPLSRLLYLLVAKSLKEEGRQISESDAQSEYLSHLGSVGNDGISALSLEESAEPSSSGVRVERSQSADLTTSSVAAPAREEFLSGYFSLVLERIDGCYYGWKRHLKGRIWDFQAEHGIPLNEYSLFQGGKSRWREDKEYEKKRPSD